VTVAIATAADARGLDEDEPLLLEALARVGVDADVAVWDDRSVDWGGYDLVVVRSTWDYPPQRDAFVAWAEDVAGRTRIANPARVLRWNTDKRYLAELAEAGLPVVPTAWLEPGNVAVLPDWDELVVKPAVSAGAKDTARYGPERRTEAGDHAAALLAAGRTVMIQPYVAEIDDDGETALMYIEGRYSHAIRKGPILQAGARLVDGLFAPEDITARQPTAAECNLAEAVLAAVPGGDRLLYARVDVVIGADGGPLLLELELTEPSLFLAFADGAADRLASAIAAATR